MQNSICLLFVLAASASWSRSSTAKHTCHCLQVTEATLAQTPGAASSFSFGSMLEIGSTKCHILDLLVPPGEERVRRGRSRAPKWGGGFARGEGLRQRRGCRPEITQQLLMEPGLALLERGSISASKSPPLRPPCGTIGCDYKAKRVQ